MIKNKLLLAALFSLSLITCNSTVSAKKSLSPQELVTSLNSDFVKYEKGKIIIYPNADIVVPMVLGLTVSSLGGITLLCENPEAGLAICTIAAMFLTYAAMKYKNKCSKPMMIIDKEGISYQDREAFWSSNKQYIPWSEVEEICTRIRSWVQTNFSHATTFNSDGSTGSTLIPYNQVVAEQDLVIKTTPYWASLFIPEQDLPVSFESFRDLISPNYVQLSENKKTQPTER